MAGRNIARSLGDAARVLGGGLVQQAQLNQNFKKQEEMFQRKLKAESLKHLAGLINNDKIAPDVQEAAAQQLSQGIGLETGGERVTKQETTILGGANQDTNIDIVRALRDPFTQNIAAQNAGIISLEQRQRANEIIAGSKVKFAPTAPKDPRIAALLNEQKALLRQKFPTDRFGALLGGPTPEEERAIDLRLQGINNELGAFQRARTGQPAPGDTQNPKQIQRGTPPPPNQPGPGGQQSVPQDALQQLQGLNLKPLRARNAAAANKGITSARERLGVLGKKFNDPLSLLQAIGELTVEQQKTFEANLQRLHGMTLEDLVNAAE
jgi:hypothetical protein